MSMISRRCFLQMAGLTSAATVLRGPLHALSSPSLTPTSYWGHPITCPYAATPVIDSVGHPERWVDSREGGDCYSAEMSVQSNHGRGIPKARFFIKHEDDYFGNYFDSISQTDKVADDSASITLDTGDNGYPTPYGPDDFNITGMVTPENVVSSDLRIFNGTTGMQIPYKDGIIAKVIFDSSPRMPDKHLQYFLAVPMKTIKEYAKQTNPLTIGYANGISNSVASVSRDYVVRFPNFVTRDNAQTLDMIFDEKPVSTQTSTTMSSVLTPSPEPVTSTSTTIPHTSTLTTSTTTRRDFISENSSLILDALLAAGLGAIGATAAYKQFRKKKVTT